MSIYTEAQVVLTQQQAQAYRLFTKKFGIDPDARLNGQQLTVTPFHCAQLMVIMSFAGGQEIKHGYNGFEVMDDMMDKVTAAMHENGLDRITLDFVDDIGAEEQWQMAKDQELRGALVPRYPI